MHMCQGELRDCSAEVGVRDPGSVGMEVERLEDTKGLKHRF